MSASQGTVKRDVLAQLSVKGRIGGRNPISTLCSQTKNDSVEGKRLVENAVRDLADEKKILVKRGANGRILEIRHARPRRHLDRTEMSPQAKREATFAKGVPAYLTDDMCSPVVVSHTYPRRWNPEGSLVDNLNACLGALRRAANEEGEAEAMSVRRALLTLPGVTERVAGSAMKYLSGMGLYISVRSGYQQSSYTVDTHQRVTEEMVEEYRRKRRDEAANKRQSPGAAEDVLSEVGETSQASHDSELLPDIPSGEDDLEPLSQLAEIIEVLENENARLQGVVDDQQSSIVQLSDRCTRLVDELAGAKQELAELQARLDAAETKPRELDPKVAAILARHQRS